MSYATFLLVFLGPFIAILSYWFWRSSIPNKDLSLRGILLLCVLAFCYTTPWDNYLVAKSVWWYGADRVLGTIAYVPYEEYAFFILQTVMSGLWCLFVQSKMALDPTPSKPTKWKSGIFAAISVVWFWSFYALTQEHLFYAGLILSWALPVLLLQFAVGGLYMFRNAGVFFWSFAPPTVYLWAADAFAIYDGIWTISSKYTTGISIGVLPIEEALFFLVTNLMVCQGLILFQLVKTNWRIPNAILGR